jgi:hypothetical protein
MAMSKTLALLLGLALLWLTAWAIAGYYMREVGIADLALSDHLSTPASRLERGADVRVEGNIVEGLSVAAPYSEKPCLAAVTHINVMSRYRDAQNKDATEYSNVVTRRAGPENIEIAVGDKRIELPLERWSPKQYSSQTMDELPPRLGVTAEQIASAKERLRNDFTRFSVSESTLDGGTRFFVVGRLEDRDGPLRLEADRVLKRIELYPGSQDNLVKELRRSGGGFRVAGWILGAGVGPLPLTVIGLVLLVMRRKRSAATVAKPRG